MDYKIPLILKKKKIKQKKKKIRFTQHMSVSSIEDIYISPEANGSLAMCPYFWMKSLVVYERNPIVDNEANSVIILTLIFMSLTVQYINIVSASTILVVLLVSNSDDFDKITTAEANLIPARLRPSGFNGEP